MVKRKITQVIEGIKTSDGAGVNLTRIIGTPELNMLDPFLLLDEFGSENPNDYIAGFPPHPHRGFETITYMMNGKFRHRDSAGNEGYLRDGSVQWMTAGRGVIHSEMPEQTEGLVRGFQLWLNLPQKKKMIDPSYQDIHAERIPVIHETNGSFKIIAGTYNGTTGPGKSHSPVLIMDIYINKNSECIIPVSSGWNAFGFIYEGNVFSDQYVSKGQLATYGMKGKIHYKTKDNAAGVFLAAGEPLNEPVARGGPFVMNTQEEILQAFSDYQEGDFI